MIMQRGVVALAGRRDDLLDGHRIDAVTGKQQLRRRLDLALGIIRRGAGGSPHLGRHSKYLNSTK